MSKRTKGKKKATKVPMIDTVAPPPGTNAAAALRELIPPPTADEVISKILRFARERAPDHPEELVQFGVFLAAFVASVDPERLEQFRAIGKAQPEPPADPGVN